MMLFGIYFPEKLTKYPGPLWWRWSKKIVVAALLVMVAVAIVISIGELENYSAIAGLEAIWDKLQPVILALDIFACGSYFISMSLKSRAATSPDVKRRFNLIYIGATVATTPLFILTIIQAVKGGAQLEKIFPEWIVLGSLIILMILPVTLAYVIIVQRAMDVRVVIRQGLQYALARRGVLVLQIILTSIIITAAIMLEGSTQRSKPQKMIIISLCFVAILWLRKLAGFVRAWVDRRFSATPTTPKRFRRAQRRSAHSRGNQAAARTRGATDRGVAARAARRRAARRRRLVQTSLCARLRKRPRCHAR